MNSSRLLGGATLFLLGLAGLCAIPGCSPASDPSAPGTKLQWRKSTPLPEPRAGHAAGLLDGKFVIAGGTWWEGEKGNWTQKIFSASTHAFDPDTESWERLPDAPFPFGYAAYTVVENRLYVLGRLRRPAGEPQDPEVIPKGGWLPVGGLRRAARDPPVRMGGQLRGFPVPAGRGGALRTHRRDGHLLHLQDGHQPAERPGHGLSRKGLAGTVTLSRQKTLALLGGGRRGEYLDVRRDRLAASRGAAHPVQPGPALRPEAGPLGGTPLPAPRNPRGHSAGSPPHSGENPLHELCQNGVAARSANLGVQPADTHARRGLCGSVCLARTAASSELGERTRSSLPGGGRNGPSSGSSGRNSRCRLLHRA